MPPSGLPTLCVFEAPKTNTLAGKAPRPRRARRLVCTTARMDALRTLANNREVDQ
jgi:hypothetical protein